MRLPMALALSALPIRPERGHAQAGPGLSVPGHDDRDLAFAYPPLTVPAAPLLWVFGP